MLGTHQEVDVHTGTHRQDIVHPGDPSEPIRKRHYELYLRSPLSRCIKIWSMINKDVQRATTKVKFKKLIKPMCALRPV